MSVVAWIPVSPTWAQVDLADEQMVLDAGPWHLVSGYAVHSYRVGPRRANRIGKLWMHRLILGLGPFVQGGVECDHVNGDRLDNRRANLRTVSRQQNMQNRLTGYGSSRYRGVSLRANGRWLAQGGVGGQKQHIGVYATEQEAALAARNWRVQNVGAHAA